MALLSNSASAATPLPALEVSFTPVGAQSLYRGDGGTAKTVQGMDIWTIGRPSTLNRNLGNEYVLLRIPHGGNGQADTAYSDSQIEAVVVDQAKKAGADAIIPLSIRSHTGTGIVWTYRLIKYTRGDAPADMAIATDDGVKDADGVLAPNGSDTGIGVTFVPDMAKYYSGRLTGKAIVHICVDRDGALVQPLSVSTTSGHSELDQAAIHMVNDMRLLPATVNGRPVDRCTDMPFKWSGSIGAGAPIRP
jgi:TonB family protein